MPNNMNFIHAEKGYLVDVVDSQNIRLFSFSNKGDHKFITAGELINGFVFTDRHVDATALDVVSAALIAWGNHYEG